MIILIKFQVLMKELVHGNNNDICLVCHRALFYILTISPPSAPLYTLPGPCYAHLAH